jgi:hypothetical protein
VLSTAAWQRSCSVRHVDVSLASWRCDCFAYLNECLSAPYLLWTLLVTQLEGCCSELCNNEEAVYDCV